MESHHDILSYRVWWLSRDWNAS